MRQKTERRGWVEGKNKDKRKFAMKDGADTSASILAIIKTESGLNVGQPPSPQQAPILLLPFDPLPPRRVWQFTPSYGQLVAKCLQVNVPGSRYYSSVIFLLVYSFNSNFSTFHLIFDALISFLRATKKKTDRQTGKINDMQKKWIKIIQKEGKAGKEEKRKIGKATNKLRIMEGRIRWKSISELVTK